MRLIAFYKPNMSSSYLAVLLVHLNSKLLETILFLLYALIKAHPTPNMSYVFDPSKYMVHNSFVHKPPDVLVLLLLLLFLLLLLLVQCVVQVSLPLVGKGRSPSYVSGGVGVAGVG